MPDRLVQRYDVDESSEPVMISKNAGEFKNPFKSPWMEHRMQSSCVSGPMVTQHHSGPEVKTREYNSCNSMSSKSNEMVRSSFDASATNGLPRYSDLLISDFHDSGRTSDAFHSAIDAISRREDAVDRGPTMKSPNLHFTHAICSGSSSLMQQGTLANKESFRTFSFCYSGHMDGLIESTSAPKGKSPQSMPFFKTRFESLISDSSLIPNDIKFLKEDIHFQQYIVMRSREQWSQLGKFVKESSAFHGPSKKYFSVSYSAPESPSSVQKANPRPIVYSGVQNDSSFSGILLKEHAMMSDSSQSKCRPFNFHGHSAVMFSERMGDSHNTSTSPQISSSVEKGEFFKMQRDQSSSRFLLQMRSDECDEHMQNNVPSPTYNSEMRLTKTKKLTSDKNLQRVVQEKSAYGLKKMKKYHSLDCLDRTIERHSKCSRVEKYFSTKENTKKDLLEAGHVTTKSTLSAESNEYGLFKITNSSAAYDCEFKQDSQTHRNSIEGKVAEDYVAGLADVQNSSSIRTDAMDTTALQSTSLSGGLTPLKLKKDISTSESLRQLEATEMLELQHVKVNIDKAGVEAISGSPVKSVIKTNAEDGGLQDLNKEKTHNSDEKILSMGSGECSTSEIDSLGAEDLFSHAKMAESPNSRILLKETAGSGPTNRWVKRLKLHSMDSFAFGTKSFKIDDAPTSGRVNKLLTRVLNYSRSNSDSTLAESIEQHKTVKSIVLSTNGVESPVESLKKSHAWIRRWCHGSQDANHTQMTSVLCPGPEAQALCEPEDTKAIPDDFEEKQFPSLAAMALMGKAVSNFRPCEFRRRGPFVVWNTESF